MARSKGRYEDDIISVIGLANKFDIPSDTLRTYLGHYSFSKYAVGKSFYIVNEGFYDALIEYLYTKRRYDWYKKIKMFKHKDCS